MASKTLKIMVLNNYFQPGTHQFLNLDFY